MSYQAFVCACDKYSWIHDYFLYYYYKNTPENLPIKFFTEEIYGEDKHPIGSGSWYQRMLRCLAHLECDDVIYLQEDFLIKSVDKDIIDEAYGFHKAKKAHITKLGNNYEFRTYSYPCNIGPHEIYLQDINDEYLLSHQPIAIFNKSFLVNSLECLEPTGPSEHELDGSHWMRKNGTTKVFCVGDAHRPKNYSEIFNFEHAIRKGEILPDAMEYLTI